MDSSSSSSNPDFHQFLTRMRSPASADLVLRLKSFIVSFASHTTDAEADSKKLQDFLMTMETNIREHRMWAHCPDEEIDSAIEGVEKYVMTKLFNRTFASSPEDARLDMEISEKICLLQHFIKPDHLDVPRVLQKEASLLFVAKELQKINAFKSPREKLLCIMNCCRFINNLLFNESLSTNHIPAGADDFLPILIYVTIRANPPQLHSNLKYIQLFRWHSKLVSEVEYYLTNLISAKSFIVNIDASSLSMDESEFQKNMQAARLAVKGSISKSSSVIGSSEDMIPSMRSLGKEKEMHCDGTFYDTDRYPFMDKEVGDLTTADIEKLLDLYKKVVSRYTLLSKALTSVHLNEDQILHSLKKSTSMSFRIAGNPEEED